jgi:DNA-binding CsgD family transcriptional regulator
MAGESSVPRPRGRVRARLRVGRLDLVVALDVLLALALFTADNAYLWSANHLHGGHHAGLALLFVAFTTAAPLALRDRRPLTAWVCSACAIGIGTLIIVPRQDMSGPYVPGAVAVYVLCRYAVAVRGPSQATITAAAVTVGGAAMIVVARGDALLSPGVTRRLIAEFARMGAPRGPDGRRAEGLTERETEVLGLMARGMSNAEIAAKLVLAEQTVKTHVGRILMKLDLRDRTQAVVYAYETGLVRPGE